MSWQQCIWYIHIYPTDEQISTSIYTQNITVITLPVYTNTTYTFSITWYVNIYTSVMFNALSVSINAFIGVFK